MAGLQPFNAVGGQAAGDVGGTAPDEFGGGLAELAAGLLAPEPDLAFDGPADAAADAAGVAPGGGLALCLEDVVADGNGEAVLLNEAGLEHLTLHTAAAVVARGTAPADHGAVVGQDVAGLAFVSFDSGLTLYYPEALDLALAAPPAA